MAIYKNGKNGILLKNDRKVVEVYKGTKKLFGYNEALSGSVVTANNIHPVEHELRVKLKSKNLFDINSAGLTSCEIQDNSIVANGSCHIDTLLSAGTYTISFEKNSDFNVVLRNGKIQNGYIVLTKNNPITFTYDASYDGYLRITVFDKGATLSNIQIEAGPTATEYTPHISDLSTISVNRYGIDITDNLQTATANADGVVEGLTSLSPNMTLTADTDGVIIDCEYVKE